MDTKEQKVIRSKKGRQNSNLVDPETLTHYFGNDEYKEGNKTHTEDYSRPDGFSAEGNEKTKEDDNSSDLPNELKE